MFPTILSLSGKTLAPCPLLAVRVSKGEIRHYLVQIGLALLDTNTGLEPSNSLEAQSGAAALQRATIPLTNRNKNIHGAKDG